MCKKLEGREMTSGGLKGAVGFYRVARRMDHLDTDALVLSIAQVPSVWLFRW